ncbi:MAG: metallophosphoesterase [Clostridia bacterium]|jgi:predicted MPP superfamily phosphohydrolase|nr:metallophosphoesterase [Clostridia bacterium]
MRSFFFVVIAIIMTLNLSWYALSDYWVRRNLADFPEARQMARWALVLWMAMILIPIVGMAIPGMGNLLEYGPWLWVAVFNLWMGAIFFWMIGVALIGIPVWGTGKLMTWWQEKKERAKGEIKTIVGQEEFANNKEAPGLSRRQLIKLGLVAAPPLLVSGGAAVSWWNMQRLNVYQVDLPVVDLPYDLEGFTITHLSDIHIGILTGRERVEKIVAAANSLNSDLAVVTGDILDQDIAFMPDMVETVGALTAPLGVYLCIGNHDKIYDADTWITNVRKAKLNLLLDQGTLIDTGKTPLKLLGIDFAREERFDEININKADGSLAAPENALKILLAHHPHAFDAAVRTGIPVTLAGHTHGGQLVLRAGEHLELFNPGRLLFRYVDGIYRSDQGHTLFVHKGSGDWFPLRIGAPAEIVQLRLVGV